MREERGNNSSHNRPNIQLFDTQLKSKDGNRKTDNVPVWSSWSFILPLLFVSMILSFSLGCRAHRFLLSRTHLLSRVTPCGDEKTELLYDVSSRQHLAVDIKGIDKAFLDRDDDLAQEMLRTAWEANLSLRSYHCQKAHPDRAVNCIGIGIKQHISFQTSLDNDVLSVNLFGIKASSLARVLSFISSHFGNVARETNGAISLLWSFNQRGNENTHSYHRTDLSALLKSTGFVMKTQIASMKIGKHFIDVFDVIESSFQGNQNTPDRIIYQDGAMINSRHTHAAHYESLVHPAMFILQNPEDIVILGDTQGAVLQEVLKHDSVDEVTLVGKERFMEDPLYCDLMPWVNCTYFEDERVSIQDGDGIRWVIDEANSGHEKVDVVIVESLTNLEDDAYSIRHFFKSVYHLLEDDGILFMQVSTSIIKDFALKNFENVANLLDEVGMKRVVPYDYFQHGLRTPLRFLLACKTRECLDNWYSNSAEAEVAIHNRITQTHSTTHPLKFFDGAMMKLYQMPHKSFENNYCKRFPLSAHCQVYKSHFDRTNIPVTDFEVKQSSLGKSAGRGVFANVGISMGSIIGFDIASKRVIFYPKTNKMILQLLEKVPEAVYLYPVGAYIYGYGYHSDAMGGECTMVDGSILTFVNHGCNQSDNLRVLTYDIFCMYSRDCMELNESVFDAKTYRSNMKTIPKYPSYNPIFLRHLELFESAFDYAGRDISVGEEIFQNYLLYERDMESLINQANHLKRICLGEELGEVTEYENKFNS